MNICLEARKPEKLKKANIEKVENDKKKTETIQTAIKGQDLYNAGAVKDENFHMLGFKGDDDEFVERRRGGRGGNRGGSRGGKFSGEAPQRKGNKKFMEINEQAFPSLT